MARLGARPRIPFRQRRPQASAPYFATAVNLLNQGISGQLAGGLRERGLRGIVLKGPALRQWLYGDSSERVSLDIDLLVPWHELEQVEAVLAASGWRYLGIDAVGADRPHCRIWERPDSGLILELHRTLAGIAAPPERAWALLSAHTERLELGGTEIEVLGVPARALHVALHAAQHGRELERTQEDLRRAAHMVPLPAWQQAARLARELQALPAFTTGLALVAEGREVLTSLGLTVERSTESTLRAAGAPALAEGLEWATRQRGLRAKVSFAASHLAPPPGYMRVWFEPARRGGLGLALAYAWRPLWLLLRVAPAAKAWLGARRGTG